MKDLTAVSGAISEEAKELILASVSANTKRAYKTSLRQLIDWLGGRSITDALLADYLTELHHTGRSPSTVAQVVASVRWRYPKAEIIGELTDRVLAGVRSEGSDRGRGQVKGLDYEQVDLICYRCVAANTIAGMRDAALIRLMSDCLLRVSEAVAANIEDVSIAHNTLTVTRSKTDQEGQGATLFVTDETMRIVRLYLKGAGLLDPNQLDTFKGALFRRMVKGDKLSQHRLTDRSARQIIKDRAKEAGVDGFISGHSLRVGAAESLAGEGVSLVELQDAGRWKDPKMPAHYARHQMASRGAVARIRNRRKQ